MADETPVSADAAKLQSLMLEALQNGDIKFHYFEDDLFKPTFYSHEYGSQELLKHVYKGNKEEVEKLLKEGALPESRDAGGYTALMKAAYNGYKEIVELLLSYGARVDEVHLEFGFTALRQAIFADHPEVVEVLLSHGADKFLLDWNDRTYLHDAAYFGSLKTVELVYDDSLINAVDKKGEGKSPLDVAVNRARDSIEVPKFLIRKGGKLVHYDKLTDSKPHNKLCAIYNKRCDDIKSAIDAEVTGENKK
jgi:ankyrin repeat protein